MSPWHWRSTAPWMLQFRCQGSMKAQAASMLQRLQPEPERAACRVPSLACGPSPLLFLSPKAAISQRAPGGMLPNSWQPDTLRRSSAGSACHRLAGSADSWFWLRSRLVRLGMRGQLAEPPAHRPDACTAAAQVGDMCRSGAGGCACHRFAPGSCSPAWPRQHTSQALARQGNADNAACGSTADAAPAARAGVWPLGLPGGQQRAAVAKAAHKGQQRLRVP